MLIDKENWIYNEGKDQLGVRGLSSGVAFRLLRPADFLVVEVSPIPETVTENMQLMLTIKIYENLSIRKSVEVAATVLRVQDDKVWMLSGIGTGLIVKTK